MKKMLVCALFCAAGVALFAAAPVAKPAAAKKAPAKAAKKAEVKPIQAEFVIVESAEYAVGKEDKTLTSAIGQFLGAAEPKVTRVSFEDAAKDTKLKDMEYAFLPLYLIKKTPQVTEKLTQHIQAGFVQDKGEYYLLPRQTRQGVFQNKVPNPGVLEVFVMSQCPYGAMAENMIIQAKKDGKLPEDKDIVVRYIVGYDDKNGFQSLHGSAEWEENIRQLLIKKYYPNKYWKYLEIRNKDYRSSRWDKAMDEAGINSSKIMKKFDTEGVELLKKEAYYADEYGVNASPTFLWEGKVQLDFGSASQIPGFEFLNPAQQKAGQPAPSGSC